MRCEPFETLCDSLSFSLYPTIKENAMNVYVCIKQVPDTESKIKLSGNGIDTSGIKWVMNPYDEFAVEEALLFKKDNPSAVVTVLCVGPKSRTVDSLRTALAMGVDNAISVDAPENLDSLQTAHALSEAIKKTGDAHIVFTGKVAIDDNQSAVSQQLANFLEIPHATVISKTAYTADSIAVDREVEGGSKEILNVKLPAVIAATKGLNNPRYASLPGIMKAKKKPITELTTTELGINTDPYVEFTDFQLPPERPSVKMIEGEVDTQVAELAKLLREEAKVL